MNAHDNEDRQRQLKELLLKSKGEGEIDIVWGPAINVKLLNEDAKLPTKTSDLEAGYDLYASEDMVIPARDRRVVKTGIAMAIPTGYAGLIWPRSGLSVKQGVDVLAGVIDSTYRGELMVCLYNTQKRDELHNDSKDVVIKKGDRIAQILIQPTPHFHLNPVDELDETTRGDKGFGSSGK